MSINPVPGISSASEVAPGGMQPSTRQSQSEPSAKSANLPDLGTLPKQESSGANNSPEASEFVQDEVQLQQDSEVKDQIVIKYLDKTTGEVVLQIPSRQALAVARGIYEEFQKRAESHDTGYSTTPASGEQGESHGH